MATDLIESRSGFHAAVRALFAEAATVGCREIVIADRDFADWPLGEPEVIASLTAWAIAHRRLTVLATGFDEMLRRHARWVAWRRTYSHVVDCRVNEELEQGGMPTLLLARGLVGLRVSDPDHYRGRVSRDGGDLLRWGELVDAVAQRSVESFPATTLGL